ncbi:DUF45 domain-containing protein [Candidatus Woesearchaeota archaeon]|nr:DUF45 domain-containing protein [Candidatus Woesearchaeota archaeon]
MKTETLEVNGRSYFVRVYYEKRNSARASIGRTISIRIPSFLNREERALQEAKLKQWIKKNLEENPSDFKLQQREYKDGKNIMVGEKQYCLNIQTREKNSSSGRIMGNTIHLLVSSCLAKEEQNAHISTLLSRCVAQHRLPELKETLARLNKEHFNRPINKIFFKHNKSNWGSCSQARNINISTRLLFAPTDVLEYVCVHELAHLIESNHSENFWKLVEKAMPNYKEKIQWLKENGRKCQF